MIRRTRTDDCLSDFAMDRRLGGELGVSEETLAREHIASCVRCARRWAELRAAYETFAAEPDAGVVQVRGARAGPRSWVVIGAVLASAAAVAAILVRVPERDGMRSKGADWRLGFYVNHRGSVREGAPGERVEPGDALRFTYTSTEPRYVAVMSVDGAGMVNTYYPASGAPRREEPGSDVALPLSTVLDDVVGDERIYGVACPHAFDLQALRDTLEREAGRPPALAGCRIETIVLHKEALRRP